jgi:methionine-rich copper-binding protein CopC
MKLSHYILVPLLVLGTASMAQAHAFLDHADPKVGSTVKGSPAEIKAWFTEELEPAFSKIQVFDASGKEVDKKDIKIDSADKTLMTVSLPSLPAGTYKVKWSAVAVDTHHTNGTFTFTVTP